MHRRLSDLRRLAVVEDFYMTEFIGKAILCEQCGDGLVISASSKKDLRDRLREQGWAPYGEGVTPLAEENAERGEFACKRCSSEQIEQRLRRLSAEALKEAGIDCAWLVIRDANCVEDYLRLKQGNQTVQIAIEHYKTDSDMREALTKRILLAIGT